MRGGSSLSRAKFPAPYLLHLTRRFTLTTSSSAFATQSGEFRLLTHSCGARVTAHIPARSILISMKNRLIRDLCLLADSTHSSYLIGDRSTTIALTSPHQRSLLVAMSEGFAPSSSAQLEPSQRELLRAMDSAGLLTDSSAEMRAPRRRVGATIARDISLQQLIARSEPEIAMAQWSRIDRSAVDISRRGQQMIRISGRTRAATLLSSILTCSGARVNYADTYEKAMVGDLDIGFAHFRMEDLGSNFYQSMKTHNSPLFHNVAEKSESQASQKPALHIHFGDIDIEELVDWMSADIAHLVAFPAVGGEVAISPIVQGGKSPCIRCMHLYEIDQYGFSRQERISLTEVGDLPAVTAYAVATAVASMALAWIDALGAGEDPLAIQNNGVGEITYIPLADLRKPQVVAIDRHPLCGCTYFEKA